MYCIDENACDIVGTFRRHPVIRLPGHSLLPWCDTLQQSAQLWN